MVRATVGWLLVLGIGAGACGGDDDEHYPPGGGGGGGGGGGSERIDASTSPDAGEVDAAPFDGSAAVAGRLCNVVDLRRPLDCPAADLTGIDVVDPSSRARDLTDAGGNFTLPVAFRTDLALAVGEGDDDTRDAVVQAGMWDGGRVDAPRVGQTAWDDLMAAIGGAESQDTASIVLYVEDDQGRPIEDADVTAPPGGSPPFYDRDAGLWDQGGATGPSGAAILLRVPAEETAEVLVTVGGADPIALTAPVRPGFLTWARLVVR